MKLGHLSFGYLFVCFFQISDLDTEDSKNDTMVDVVFKKALKEFRLNIFNSYSTALAVSLANTETRLLPRGLTPAVPSPPPPPQMDDGKSIRYKDLYALFEHILEKTMRQEQRNWRESPVTVWVNTFKVFLDEFMTEYKPLDSVLSKVDPSPDGKPSPLVTGVFTRFSFFLSRR